MSFGLCNALATFQKLITKTFKPYFKKIMQVFLDDFSVYGDKKIIWNNFLNALKSVGWMGLALILKNVHFV